MLEIYSGYRVLRSAALVSSRTCLGDSLTEKDDSPALAAGQSKTTQAPVIKTEQAKQLKPNVRNANARMGRRGTRSGWPS